jgi:hypothetical protein
MKICYIPGCGNPATETGACERCNTDNERYERQEKKARKALDNGNLGAYAKALEVKK